MVCRGATCELFDLDIDPRETVDVAEIHPTALAALRDSLGDHLGRLVPNDWDAPAPQAEGLRHEQEELDDETRRQLAALGYIDD